MISTMVTSAVVVDEGFKALEDEQFQRKVKFYLEQFSRVKAEVRKIVVGQDAIIDSLLEALLANGHVLVEGIPGVGKTLTIRALARVTGCQFSRIQFTPDLLPTDIVGITTYEEGKGFFTVKGPVFSNFVLADEINRSPPKVQSALLESMQEHQATIGKETFQLPSPFFVMATQNPVEQLGTYKLPEAQVDRFLFKIIMSYPAFEDEVRILNQNITTHEFSEFSLMPVLSQMDIMDAQNFVKKIYTNPKIERYIIRLVDATRNPKKYNIDHGKYLSYGLSPRAGISLHIASKAHALVHGRGYVIPDDVKDVAYNTLRHRILLNFEGEAEEIKAEAVIKELLEKVPIL
jgi:MoxR-like ATPase